MSLKKVTVYILTILGFFAYSQTLANLIIKNQSQIDRIDVMCEGVPGKPIFKNKPLNESWDTIFAIIGDFKGSCSFHNTDKHLGDATIAINPEMTKAKITTLKVDPKASIRISITPAVDTLSDTITVTISDQ